MLYQFRVFYAGIPTFLHQIRILDPELLRSCSWLNCLSWQTPSINQQSVYNPILAPDHTCCNESKKIEQKTITMTNLFLVLLSFVVKYFESYLSILSFKFSFCFIKSCFCPRILFSCFDLLFLRRPIYSLTIANLLQCQR